MAIQEINIGAVANDPNADTARAAFNKANENFSELDGRVDTAQAGADASVKSVNGVEPDIDGNVTIEAGGVQSVNGIGPATDGSVTLDADDVSAIPASEKGAADGVAELGVDGVVPSAQLPPMVMTVNGEEPDTSGNVEIAAASSFADLTGAPYDNTALASALDEKADAAAVTSALDGKQDLASALTAIAALVPAADRMPFFTGADSGALSVLTSFARTLLDDADAATARATLGVEGLKLKVGTFTRDLTLASGSQVITGVGFQPKLVLFFAGEASAASTAATSLGADDGVTHFSLTSRGAIAAGTWGVTAACSINQITGGASWQQAFITAMSSDGFMLGWVKTGSPAITATIGYVAFG